jgi:hypothetical protein
MVPGHVQHEGFAQENDPTQASPYIQHSSAASENLPGLSPLNLLDQLAWNFDFGQSWN